MQLAPVNPSLKFVPVTSLPKATGTAPKLETVSWDQRPDGEEGLVSIRYKGTDNTKYHDVHQVTVRNNPFATGEDWYQLTGSFDDAVRAARDLAKIDGYEDNPATGHFARTSVAILDAGKGAWQMLRLQYPDSVDDDMPAIFSMPIDPQVGEATSDVSIPYGYMNGVDFEHPDKGVAVRFDDKRVAAVVGVDSIALAPKR
jgi:hypothetical protein